MRSVFLLLLFVHVLTAYAQSNAEKGIVVIAHRGDHSAAPENTLKAFENAIMNGADYIEVDLRTTSDNKLVVLHDQTVDRVTNGHGEIKSMKFSEVRKLIVSDRSNPGHGQHKIPTFDEVLKLAKAKINIYLDFKDADIPATVELIKRNGMEKHVIVYINKAEHYTSWRKNSPTFPLMVSLPDDVTDESTLRQFLNTVDAEILDGDADQYSIEMVQLAKNMGRKIWVDVQSMDEGPKSWESAVAKGMDGLQTDHLKELNDWLKK
ncbi:MAG: glycerophosphodiester phosphodiesterase family protein [Chryseolinea sp.]